MGFAGAHPEFAAYIDAIIADRREAPRNDFVTRLITREVDGRRLTDIEARAQLVFLFISGNETTRHLLGNLLYRIASDPALFAELAADRKLIEPAVVCLLFAQRGATPIDHTEELALLDAEYAMIEVPEQAGEDMHRAAMPDTITLPNTASVPK